MRVLEGDQEVVTKLASTIEQDFRHKGVFILLRGTSEQRLFADWSVGFRDLADGDVARTPGYTDFRNTPLTSAEFTQDQNRCMKLLRLFKTNM